MMNVLKLSAAAALTLFLAACSTSQQVVSSLPDLSNIYGQYAVAYATLHGPFPTVIHGNPFAIPKAEADAAIMNSLRLPRWFTPAEFVQRPTNAKPKGYRLVFLFNPANPIPTSKQACDSLEDIEIAPHPTRVRAVFCAGNRSLSKIDGWMTATSPQDPAFQPFINMLVGLAATGQEHQSVWQQVRTSRGAVLATGERRGSKGRSFRSDLLVGAIHRLRVRPGQL